MTEQQARFHPLSRLRASPGLWRFDDGRAPVPVVKVWAGRRVVLAVEADHVVNLADQLIYAAEAIEARHNKKGNEE